MGVPEIGLNILGERLVAKASMASGLVETGAPATSAARRTHRVLEATCRGGYVFDLLTPEREL